MQIQNRPPQIFEGSHVWPELLAYMAVEDLVRVKHALDPVTAMASELLAWQPCLHYVRGGYHLLRGDLGEARAELEAALALTAAGQHLAWPALAGALLTTLVAQGQEQEALARGKHMLEQAEAEALHSLRHYIETPLALAHAALGEHEAAIARLQRVIEQFERLGSAGVPLGNAYEARARVAVLMNDTASFRRYSALCAEQYRAGHNPALTAKYERLLLFARKWRVYVSSDLERAADHKQLHQSDVGSHVATLLGQCHGPAERAQETLRVLVAHCGAAGGFLYVLQSGGPILRAQLGDKQPPAELDTQVARHVAAELTAVDEATATVAPDAVTSRELERWSTADGTQLVPMVLAHESAEGFVITGVAALLPSADGVFQSPEALLRILSRALLEAGDAVTAIAR
jgi:tetratricopeptide (TPR) repeat protein